MSDKNNEDTPRDADSTAQPGRQAVPYYHSRVPYTSGGSPGLYSSPGNYGPAHYASPYAPSPYAAAPYVGGGAYGQPAPQYGGAQAGGGEENSMFGTLSIGRILRVCRQRWITIAVFTAIGLGAAFVMFKVWTPMYEARATFELTARRMVMQTTVYFETGTMAFNEQANTTIFRMQQPKMFQEVINTYRANHPSSTVNDDTLRATLGGMKMDLRRNTRMIDVTVKSTDAELAANLANSFVQTTETFTQGENRDESEKGILWLQGQLKSQESLLGLIDKEISDFKQLNTVDIYLMRRDALASALTLLNNELMQGELMLIDANQIFSAIQAVVKDTAKISILPLTTPRMAEIETVYSKLVMTTSERDALLTHLTQRHPEVVAKERELEIHRRLFSDVLMRTHEAAAANIDLIQRRYDAVFEKLGMVNGEIEQLQARIDNSTSGLSQLMSRRDISYLNLENLLKRVQESHLALDQGMSSTREMSRSLVPQKAVEPKPMIIIPAGVVFGLLLGLVFVLLIDQLEDQVTSIADIEHRLRLKTLAIVPHVRWKNRWEIALSCVEDKFSHFAESFAGLRNLLESPRYREYAHVIMPISTQPAEGKTITACNLALSYAVSGKRVLLVDFDLRRPRLARVFKKNSAEFQSLAEALVKNDPSVFDSLVIPSGYENLSLVLSKPSSKISPANLMGTGILNEFFIWARQNYDKVLIDSPPFGIVSDTVALGSLVDCVLMLACPNRSHFRPLRHAVRYLTEAGTRIAGAVINDVDFGHGSTFAGYDYHYRYAYQYRGKYKDYVRQPADEDDDAETPPAKQDPGALPEAGVAEEKKPVALPSPEPEKTGDKYKKKEKDKGKEPRTPPPPRPHDEDMDE